MLLIDIDELEQLNAFWPLLSNKKGSLLRFRRSDYHGADDLPLKQAIKQTTADILGFMPTGKVMLLTQTSLAGFCFNPVSFAYLYSQDGDLEAIFAEVTNTPWQERHSYALDVRAQVNDQSITELGGSIEKSFHVSPFMGMDQIYQWSTTAPAQALQIQLASNPKNRATPGTEFVASLQLKRVDLNSRQIIKYLSKQPLGTASNVLRIYLQAAILLLTRAPYFANPGSFLPTETKRK